MLRKETPDVVINAAAFTNVEKAEENKELAYAVNGYSLVEICSEINKFNLEQNTDLPLIHFSTDYVFDGKGNKPNRPSDRVRPINVYGETKAEGEKNILSADISYMILRTSWVVSKYRNNFLKTILKKIQNESEISVVGDQYGAPTSAEFVADFLGKILLNHSVNSKREIHHICGQGETTWFNLANFIFEKTKEINGGEGKLVRINKLSSDDLESRVQRPKNSRLCCDSLINNFPFRHIHWKNQVAEIVEDLLK